MKPPIVLLTDYGIQDPYAGILHGVIAMAAPQTTVINLTHGISPQNVRQASFYLEDSFRYFPKGSIFVCVVDPGVGTGRSILCVKSKSYYFLAPDNGLLSDVSKSEPFLEVRKLMNPKYSLKKTSATFHGRDFFAPAACALARKLFCFKNLGPVVKKFTGLKPLRLLKTETERTGEVVYFDHFGNAVTNLKRKEAADVFWNRSRVMVGGKNIGPIQKTYGDKRAMLALWNSADRLEIAIPRGKAASFLKIGTKIQVKNEK